MTAEDRHNKAGEEAKAQESKPELSLEDQLDRLLVQIDKVEPGMLEAAGVDVPELPEDTEDIEDTTEEDGESSEQKSAEAEQTVTGQDEEDTDVEQPEVTAAIEATGDETSSSEPGNEQSLGDQLKALLTEPAEFDPPEVIPSDPNDETAEPAMASAEPQAAEDHAPASDPEIDDSFDVLEKAIDDAIDQSLDNAEKQQATQPVETSPGKADADQLLAALNLEQDQDDLDLVAQLDDILNDTTAPADENTSQQVYDEALNTEAEAPLQEASGADEPEIEAAAFEAPPSDSAATTGQHEAADDKPLEADEPEIEAAAFEAPSTGDPSPAVEPAAAAQQQEEESEEELVGQIDDLLAAEADDAIAGDFETPEQVAAAEALNNQQALSDDSPMPVQKPKATKPPLVAPPVAPKKEPAAEEQSAGDFNANAESVAEELDSQPETQAAAQQPEPADETQTASTTVIEVKTPAWMTGLFKWLHRACYWIDKITFMHRAPSQVRDLVGYTALITMMWFVVILGYIIFIR